jgi:hypothetical protein
MTSEYPSGAIIGACCAGFARLVEGMLPVRPKQWVCGIYPKPSKVSTSTPMAHMRNHRAGTFVATGANRKILLWRMHRVRLLAKWVL